MCSDVTAKSETGTGKLLLLDKTCKVEHVMEHAALKLVRKPAPAGKRPEDQPFVQSSQAGFHLFHALADCAKTLVIENYYFDLDTRSEVGELQETRFGVMVPFTSRYHFFGAAAHKGERLRDFVARAANTYIGYSIIRHQFNGRLGRSLAPTRSAIYDSKGALRLSADVVHRQTRTAVVEHLNLYGVELKASGVAFMEQDGSLLRCAHVSAWICHYSAVLRNSVPRRTTAHFHRTGDSHRALGRRYPSIGLSVEEMSSMLRRSDMPPERLDREVLSEGRNLSWSDPKSHHETIDEFQNRSNRRSEENKRLDAQESVYRTREDEGEKVPAQDREDLARQRKKNAKATDALIAEIDAFWIRENLVASICRYLNSGVPLILIRHQMSHTQVVVGYLRNLDVPVDFKVEGLGDSEVVQLIVSDDAQGPFRMVGIDELVAEVDSQVTEVLVPLPHSLWMPGAVAEKIATKLVAQAAVLRSERLEAWGAISSEKERAAYKDVLDGLLVDFDELERTDKYTMHVFSTTGVALKRSVATRLAKLPDFVRDLATLQLPKYVWVGEIVERAIHGKPSVRGMIVLDASQPWSQDLDGHEALEVLPLFVHIPGHIQTSPFGYGFAGVPRTSATDQDDEAYWSRGPFDTYATGRWGQDRLSEQTAGGQASQAKIAMVTE